MAESNLSFTQNQLRVEAANEAGFGEDSSLWTSKQQSDLTRAMKTGLSRFWCPPVLPREKGIHLWSFLRPIKSQTFWPTKTATSGATITTDGSTTVTSSGSSFYDTMIGKSLVAYTNDASQTLVGTVGTIASISGSTITLAAGAAVANGTYRWGMVADGAYALSDDYGGINGTMTHAAGSGQCKLTKVNENRIREYQGVVSTPIVGKPLWFAVRPRSGFTGAAMQRWEALLAPIPDADYVLSYRMDVCLDALTTYPGSTTYLPGGARYAMALRSSILAAVESEIFGVANGPRYAQFITDLISAVEYDRAHNLPDTLGQMHDPAMRRSDDNGVPIARSTRLIYQGSDL